MIYRIDFQHFLSHAIDHFTLTELTHMQYAIISAKVQNGGRAINMAKINQLYPDPEIVTAYYETKDKNLLEKMYLDMISPKDKDVDPKYRKTNNFTNTIYLTFINPLMNHDDIVIICDKEENDYIDVLCKYLKKEFAIEVIDLNELFTKGRVGPIYIDRSEIRDKAVDVRRAAAREQLKTMSSTRDGKAMIIAKMSKKDKIKKLREFGIKVTESDMKDLDALLLEEWCEEDGSNSDY